MSYIFISNLKSKIESFLTFKHSMGIKYESASYYLRKLDKYNFDHDNSFSLEKDWVERWAYERSMLSQSQDRSWIPPIRQLGLFLQSCGDNTAYVLDNKFVMQHYHAEIYLFSQNEIETFFEECDRYVLKQKGYMGRPYVFPALFRLLFSCGLRCREARLLKSQDVHLNDGYIDIIQSKAYRDRRIFLSTELIDYLNLYNSKISICFTEREYFFPSPTGGAYSKSAISSNFKSIWKSAGLPYDGKIKPRAYDFRHHFACANIKKWSEEGKDTHAMLPYLMRFMGHSSIESTYYYIHLIPDYFPQYSSLALSTEALLPEVDEYEI